MSIQQEELVKKAIAGNVDAYGTLVEEHKEYLYKMAFLYTKDEEMALDVVQETLLKGFVAIKKLKDPALFRTWITRILINTAKGMFHNVIAFTSAEELENMEGQKKETIEERMDLYHAIDLLPEKYRTVVVLKYFSEMKISEIALTMGIPEGSVSAYLTRAKTKLRDYLKEDYIYAQ